MYLLLIWKYLFLCNSSVEIISVAELGYRKEMLQRLGDGDVGFSR